MTSLDDETPVQQQQMQNTALARSLRLTLCDIEMRPRPLEWCWGYNKQNKYNIRKNTKIDLKVNFKVKWHNNLISSKVYRNTYNKVTSISENSFHVSDWHQHRQTQTHGHKKHNTRFADHNWRAVA